MAVAVAIAFVIGIPIWIWVTSRGTTTAFPERLLQAEGVVLTAAVFVLALGQNNFRRDVEGILTDAQRKQDDLTEAYL
jgi:hypothetical protein